MVPALETLLLSSKGAFVLELVGCSHPYCVNSKAIKTIQVPMNAGRSFIDIDLLLIT
jgi:hypothetical protein